MHPDCLQGCGTRSITAITDDIEDRLNDARLCVEAFKNISTYSSIDQEQTAFLEELLKEKLSDLKSTIHNLVDQIKVV